jgi:hypothetical protein
MLELVRREELGRGGPRVPVPEITRYLSDLLGESVTAYLSGLDGTNMVRAWSRGFAEPSPDQLERLRVAYEAAQCLVVECGEAMTRSWFFGTNPSLHDTAPAYVLRHWEPRSWESVLSAAQEFAEL